MRRRLLAASAAALLLSGAASANPDGAPWGAANPAAAHNCWSCHFDGDPVFDSASITLFFMDREISSGEPVDIYVQFRNPDNKNAGLQIISTGGEFTSAYEDIEANGAQARSLASRDNASWSAIVGTTLIPSAVMWKLRWTPPENPNGDVHVWIAVNESNDDQSPFGDRIHFKSIKIIVPEESLLLPALR